MSIPLLAQATPHTTLAYALITVAVTAVLAFAAGVFRRQSVVGPPRMGSGEPVSIIWMLLLLGFGIWVMIPTAYAVLKYGAANPQPATAPSTAPTTSPTTSPVINLSPAEMVLLGLVSAGGVLVTMLIANRAIRTNAFRQLGLTGETFTRLPVPATLAIIIVLPLMFAVSEFTQMFWQMVGLEHPNAHPLLRIFEEDAARGLRAMVVISAIFVAPFFEELLFRGHLQTALLYSIQWLIRPHPQPQLLAVGPEVIPNPEPAAPLASTAEELSPGPAVRWLAILLTSFCFTLVHQELWMMPPIFLLSLCLGYVYERTGNLWVSIFLHGAFNTVNVALFIYQGS